MRSLKTKILILSLAACILASAVLTIAFITQINKLESFTVETTRKNLTSSYDEQIKQEVEIVVSMLKYFNQLYSDGTLTLDEAKAQAKEAIRPMRYGESGYFWIDDSKGNNVLLPPSPDSEGKNRYNLQDVNGKYLVQELIDAALDGGGFTDYYFPKPGETEASQKRGYTEYFAPFDFVVGTGNYVDYIEAAVGQEEATLQAAKQSSIQTFAFLLAGVLILSAAASFFIGNLISKPAVALLKLMNRAGTGDFQVRAQIHTKDEVGQLAEGFNSMIQNVVNVLSTAQTMSEEVSSASIELSTAVEDISALSLNMNEGIDSLSNQTNVHGKEVMDEQKDMMGITTTQSKDVNSAIKNLEAKSSEIENILTVLSSISFQTNMLSLNASVEAARAGDSGKGFAVVANEVRNLAMQSSESAGQIDTIIQQVQDGITDSVNKMERVSQAIKTQEISLEKTIKIFGEISKDVEDLNENLRQVFDSRSGQNALIAQIADASNSLSAKAQELNDQIIKFKL